MTTKDEEEGGYLLFIILICIVLIVIINNCFDIYKFNTLVNEGGINNKYLFCVKESKSLFGTNENILNTCIEFINNK